VSESSAALCEAELIVPEACVPEVAALENLSNELGQLHQRRGQVKKALRGVEALSDTVRRSCAHTCNANLAALDDIEGDVEKACKKSGCPEVFAAIDSVRAIEQSRCSACPSGCSDHGVCTELIGLCVCDLGASGSDCSECAPGYVQGRGGCRLEHDTRSTVWPNSVSRANSDPWLVAHHDDITLLRPNVLVLLYANPGTREGMTELVERVAQGFSESAKVQGRGPTQLEYQFAKIVDLRDGVDGRPPAPEGFPFENSTLYPRKFAQPGQEGIGTVDYARFFAADYAQYLGFPDPDRPGEFLDLCTLINRGEVHEVWFVASGDVPDVTGLEVGSIMQNYSVTGNPIPGSVARCANGCVDQDVPFCGRSIHIGAVNYNRGPGCFLHSKGHDVEFGLPFSMPQMREWFVPFANFDLQSKYGLPFTNLYALDCEHGPCMSFLSPTHAQFFFDGRTFDVDPFDPVCGNVHFAPTGTSDFDYFNPGPVISSCTGFGRHCGPGGTDAAELIGDPLPWAGNSEFGDCGGEFLVWWYQNMPSHNSGQTFPDGRLMKSVWPFTFY
jgi:hypothetical protein